MKSFDPAFRGWLLAALASIFLVSGASCSKEGSPEPPWNFADTADPNGWWTYDNWKVEKVKFPEGTRFEFETIHTDGSHRTSTWMVRSAQPASLKGVFNVQLTEVDGSRGSQRSQVPPHLYFDHSIPARNEKLVAVKTPAGSFLAGRLWAREKRENADYVTDTWYVPDIPLPVQIWSRPVSEQQLYDPPAEGPVPPGTFLNRLTRIEKP